MHFKTIEKIKIYQKTGQNKSENSNKLSKMCTYLNEEDRVQGTTFLIKDNQKRRAFSTDRTLSIEHVQFEENWIFR
jgi:hypothetical protein